MIRDAGSIPYHFFRYSALLDDQKIIEKMTNRGIETISSARQHPAAILMIFSKRILDMAPSPFPYGISMENPAVFYPA